MAYKVIILYQLYMPSYFLGTFTEYPQISDSTKGYFAFLDTLSCFKCSVRSLILVFIISYQGLFFKTQQLFSLYCLAFHARSYSFVLPVYCNPFAFLQANQH